MRIQAYATIAASITALAVPAATGAVTAPRADRATHEKANALRANRVPVAPRPKAVAKAKSTAKKTTRPLLIWVVPVITSPAVESGVGGADNCASYTGCTTEEYCIVWGLRCELVPPPNGSLQLRESVGL